MEGSPFPRLTVFAQHADAVRDRPLEPTVQPEPDLGVEPTDHIDGPVSASFAAAVVEDAVRAEDVAMHTARQPRVVEVIAPDGQDVPRARPSHAVLLEADGHDDEGLPHVPVHHLHVRDVARELLRARLIAIAERRERRSAWEIAFILLAAAVTVLLITPPVVQIFLAMHGVEA